MVPRKTVSSLLITPPRTNSVIMHQVPQANDDEITAPPIQHKLQLLRCCCCSTTTAVWWSNLSFLTGSILYVWVAIWDVTSPLDDDNDDDDWVSLVENYNDWGWYDFLMAAAPFMYVVNAGIDFHRAFQQQSSTTNEHAEILNQSDDQPIHDDRRAYRWEQAVTIIFGIAAILDMTGTLVYSDDLDAKAFINYFPSGLSVHLYLLQSILALWGADAYHNCQTARRLLQGGEMLFLVGSLIDVVISYLDVLESNRVRRLEWWALLSAFLWLLDALLYILADVVDHYHGGSIIISVDVEDMTKTTSDSGSHSPEFTYC